MANPTPAQLAAFASLIGITPDTHRHLFNHRPHCCECGSASRLANGSTWVCSNDSCPAFDYGFFGAKGYKQAQRLVAELPPLDTPAGDDVFLAPFLRWCGGAGQARSDMWIENWASNITTIDLLERCQSARVPEIVAIFGEGE